MGHQQDTARDFHQQDWAIIVEALATFGGNPNQVETPRKERAWELIEIIAAEHRMRAAEMIRQIDHEWPQKA